MKQTGNEQMQTMQTSPAVVMAESETSEASGNDHVTFLGNSPLACSATIILQIAIATNQRIANYSTNMNIREIYGQP